MLFEDRDVAVVDLTHGGIPLARNIAEIARSVTGIDVYHTVDSAVLAGLEDDGIEIAGTIPEKTNLVVAPVHLDPGLIPDHSLTMITHHQAVGELLLNAHPGGKVIEITGTGAKTSTAMLLAGMLSRQMSVVSHTSRGVEHWQHGKPVMLHHGLSIAPGSILEVLELCNSIDPDVYIFEISLGGTGAADLGIITSLEHVYRIAGGSRSSTEAKRQMIDQAKQGSTLLIPAQTDVLDGVRVVTCSDRSRDAEYWIDPESWTIWCGDRPLTFTPNTGYDPRAYTTAMICATAAAALLEVDPRTIGSTLADFQGVEGRMQVVKRSGRVVLDNSNSGLNPASLELALEYSRHLPDHRVWIIGEEAQQVCEGLDPGSVRAFIHQHGLDDIILVGERMGTITGSTIHHAGSLEAAMEMAVSLTKEDDLIISCVKCFR